MSRIDNVTQGELQSLLKRVAALEKATPLASASVGRGRLRLYDGSELLIEDGNLTVSGTETVTGTLGVTGTLTVTGTLEADGTIKLTGPVTISGVTKITGDTEITGSVEVDGGGKITVGDMVLDSSVNLFGAVGGISGPSTIALDAPTVRATGNFTAQSLYINGSDVIITSLPSAPAGAAANLYINPATGILYLVA